MNITTSRARYILASMLALATAACGGDPCIPTIIADTSIIAARRGLHLRGQHARRRVQ